MNFSRFVFGQPIPKARHVESKLPKFKALAIFSSDALSSVAYATEEMLIILALAGILGFSYLMNISVFIIILIVIVGISYKQAITAYPQGGGAYVVSRENLGKSASLVAAVALLIDYILTVAVSVSAGIQALTSAVPELFGHAVILAMSAILILTWLNIRGIRESANILLVPTYLFISMVLLMIGIGLYHYIFQGALLDPSEMSRHAHYILSSSSTVHALTLILILRAFSSGCSAMTGIEAISNGVSAFQAPSNRNANITLTILIVLLIVMFGGISWMSESLHLSPLHNQTILSQLGREILGSGFFYYVLQFGTCAILLVAANTSFAGFPMLASMIAQDGYLPKQLKNVGDRLAFNNGIVVLAFIAAFLIIMFQANTTALIPLYSIGVFIAFSLCQAGLVLFWIHHRNRVKGWWFKCIVNAFGCLCTSIVVLVVLVSKFTEGAWLIVIFLPLLYWFCDRIYAHYAVVNEEMKVSADEGLIENALQGDYPLKVIVPIAKIHKGTIAALKFAKRLSDDITPIVVNINEEATQKLLKEWAHLKLPEEVQIIDSNYQSTLRPLIKAIRKHDLRDQARGLSVIVIPRAAPSKWYHEILHNQTTALFKLALKRVSKLENRGETRIIVEVPYQLYS